MDGVYNTELTAPYDIFQHTVYRDNIKAMNTFLVAESLDPVTTFEGITILPHFSFMDEEMPNIDILVVPSAAHHLDTDLENKALIEWVAQVGTKALYVTSHCDGAFILAKAGLLEGHACTTFPSDTGRLLEMFPSLDVRSNTLFVHDDRFITSAGGAKSFEAALYLTELLYGAEITRDIAQGLVIDWDVNTVPHIVIENDKTDNVEKL
jgi:transcriptional regulator GlxA family with amidase domain